MASHNDDLSWRNINEEAFTGHLAKARNAYKAANAAARKARAEYELVIEKSLYAGNHVMDTHEVRFSHKFGRLAYAALLKPVGGKPAAKSPQGALTL